MDNTIHSSIQTRRDALYEHYDLPPEARRKAEALFGRMEEFGKRCRDRAEFEEKFATQTLNREYNNLFVEFTAYVRTPDNVPTPEEQAAQMAADHARSVARQQATSSAKGALMNALPREVTDWRTYGIYNIPILGQIASAFNQLNILQRLFGNRKRKKQEEPEEENEE